MARGDPLPISDRVARGIRPEEVDDGVFLPSAFALSPRDKRKLSTDWVECVYAEAKDQNIEGSLRRLATHLTIRPQLVAILSVKGIRFIKRGDRQLDAVEDPHASYCCHSAIIGMKNDVTDLQLQQDLASLANSGQRAELK